MAVDLAELATLSEADILERAQRDPKWFEDVTAAFAVGVDADRKETQLAWYKPANPMAAPIHNSMAREIAIVGGNRSSKTDTMLAEFAIQLTGHVPLALQATYPREKIRQTGIRARLCCNSLTDTLEPIIKPKLRWDQWNGIGAPDEGRGHWGWIPRHCLVGGSWEKAYSEKTRTLTVSADNYWVGSDGSRVGVRNYSTCQMMSYDQDLSAYVGSSLHLVGHDELPPTDIYRENRLRTLDVRGTIMTAFTPPDEGGVSRADTSWFYDHVFQPGLPGPNKSPIIDTFQLFTEQNAILGKREVEELLSLLTDDQRRVRMHGEFIHLSGVIYKDFATSNSWWCFPCNKRIVPMYGHCLSCQGQQIAEYVNVIEPHPVPKNWPVVFVIDPHPRKADAIGWFAITPMDDIVMIAELETQGTAEDVARQVKMMEDALEIRPVRRLMDPNIAVESNDKLQRGWTIQRAYDEVGLRCSLANDEVNVGIEAVQTLLRPDRLTHRPRFRVFSSCHRFVHGMTHWSFDDWTRQGDREPKEKVRDVAKDFPDVLRYLALDRPTYRGLTFSNANAVRRKPPPRGY
jgi:phage terminase large subunit-like protein